MNAEEGPDTSPFQDPRESAHFTELFQKYVEELQDRGFIDPDAIVDARPDIGTELVEDLETYIQLRPIGEAEVSEAPLGTLGDYTLRRQIGRGGMGVVYEAWENSMDRPVALKVLPAGIAADDRAVTRFTQEARLAGKLNHENVVRVYATGVREGTPWYSMEFVEGETLAQVLARIKDAEPETETPFGKKDSLAHFSNLADVFADVADGLQHAHSKGVTHRDIKPSNLILDSEGRLRILDFGLARLEGQESLTVSGDVMGTPLYMSPEQARRRKVQVDHRTDIYSLGATLYETLCGRPPFRGKDHADTLSQIVERNAVDPRRINARVPRDLETIVLKCLRKDAADRFGTAEALAQDLRRFARGDAIEARPENRLERMRREVGHHRVAIVSVLVVVVVGVLGALFFAEVSQRANEKRVADYRRDVEFAAKLLLRGATTRFATFEGTVGERLYGMQPLVQPDDYVRLWSSSEGGPLEQAIAVLERTAASVPERFEAHYYLARAYVAAGQTANAADALERCLEHRGGFAPALVLASNVGLEHENAVTPSESWSEAWSTAWRLAAELRWKEAAEAYDQLERGFGAELYLGSSIELHLARGIALQRAGRDWDAAEAFLRARELDPEFLEPWLLLAGVYQRLDKASSDTPRHSEATLEKLLRIRGDDQETIAWIAATCVATGELEAAQRWCEQIRDDVIRLRIQSRCYLYRHEHDKALATAEEAFQLHPQDLAIRENLALALIFSNSQLWTDDAARAFDRARKLLEDIATRLGDPCSTAPLLAGILCRRGETARALKLLDRCVESSPSAPLLFGRAYVQWHRFDFRRVIEDYRAAQAALGPHGQPLSTWAGIGYAYALQTSGEPQAAEREIELIANGAPQWAPARWFWGAILRGQGRHAEALEQYEASVELADPVRPSYVQGLTDALLGLDRFADAERQARSLIARRPDSPVGFACLGDARLAQDRLREAVRCYADACVLPTRRPGRRPLDKLTRLLRGLEEPAIAGLGELDAHVEEKRSRDAATTGELGLLALAALRKTPEPNLGRARELAESALASAASPPQRGEALATIAVVERACGREAVAFRTLERALRHPSAHRESAELLERWKASAPDLAPPLPERLEELAAFVEANPLVLDAHLARVEAIFAAGRPEEAERHLDDLLLGSSESPSLMRDAWLDFELHRLGRSVDELRGRLTTLTSAVAEVPRPLQELRWLLERLIDGETLRINCGGGSFEDGLGRAWSRGRFFVGGRKTEPCIESLEETLGPLHQSAREFDEHRASDVAYRVPLPNGRYDVRLHMAERQVTVRGARRFDMRLEGREVLSDFDPFAELGLGNPGIKEFDNIDVNDGRLDLELVPRAGSARLYGLEIERTGK